MARNNKNVKVDFNKLAKELERRDRKFSTASLEMGFSHGYLSSMRCEGHLPQRTMVMLKTMYDINAEDIVLGVVEKPVAPVEANGVDMAALQKCITEAVKEAFVWYANQ